MLVAVTVLVFVALGITGARLLTGRQPRRDEPVPRSFPLPIEAVRLTAHDGVTTGAWLVPGAPDAPRVILLHGHGSSRTRELGTIRNLASRGFTVLAPTLRAHGDSDGDLNDVGWSARADLVAAVEHLERNPGKRPVIVGISMGAATAAFASGALGDRVAGYVLQSPYRDLLTAVRRRVVGRLAWPFSAFAVASLRVGAWVVLPRAAESIDVVAAIRGVPAATPILVIAGEADTLAWPSEARDVVASAGPHARLELFPGADHNHVASSDPARWNDLVFGFIRTASAPH